MVRNLDILYCSNESGWDSVGNTKRITFFVEKYAKSQKGEKYWELC